MKRPGLFWCLIAACVGALMVTALQMLLWPLLGGVWTFRAIVVAVPLAYSAFLLGSARERVGRVVMAVGSTLLAGSLFVGPFSLPVVLMGMGVMVWGVRALCFHRTFLGALLDAVLGIGGLAAGVAAYASTRSLPTAAWTALLVQSAFVFIPQSWGKKADGSRAVHAVDRFDRAYQVAEGALRDLAAR